MDIRVAAAFLPIAAESLSDLKIKHTVSGDRAVIVEHSSPRGS